MTTEVLKKSCYNCYHCGKIIKGKMTYIVPPRFAVVAYGATEKAYHPKCYAKSEEAAAKELGLSA